MVPWVWQGSASAACWVRAALNHCSHWLGGDGQALPRAVLWAPSWCKALLSASGFAVGFLSLPLWSAPHPVADCDGDTHPHLPCWKLSQAVKGDSMDGGVQTKTFSGSLCWDLCCFLLCDKKCVTMSHCKYKVLWAGLYCACCNCCLQVTPAMVQFRLCR